jgi:phenylalanyl-tRNA synthetase beta chain
MRQVGRIENPMSADQSIMRPTLLGSLLDAARTTRATAPDVALFESGTVYPQRRRPGPLADEHHAPRRAAQRPGAPRPGAIPTRGEADFFAAKGAAHRAARRCACPGRRARRGEWPFLHPGRSAAVLVGGERVGWLGEMHPLVAALGSRARRRCSSSTSAVASALPGASPYTDLRELPRRCARTSR